MKYNHVSKTPVKTMKLRIPTIRTVQWLTILIAEHKWNYESNIPTMRTVQWITILIAEHHWNTETKHTN